MAATSAALGALVLSGPARAEDEAFNPDRPAVADSPNTVPSGAFMMELGSTLNFDDPIAQNLLGGVLRFGVVQDFELRIGLPTLYQFEVGDERELELGDVAVGAKYHLPVSAIDLGIVGMLTLPTATGILDHSGMTANVALNAFKQLDTKVGVGGNAGMGINGIGTSELRESIFASVLGTFVVATDVSLFAQAFTAQHLDGGDLGLGVGAGVFALLADRVQVDLGLDAGLLGGYSSLLLQVGTSIQF